MVRKEFLQDKIVSCLCGGIKLISKEQAELINSCNPSDSLPVWLDCK